jgi:hypothetical protein
MTNSNACINEAIIYKLGLQLSNKLINASIAPNSRVFDCPYLENVFVLESDLYGNRMPDNSCFLAFYGIHGLIGKELNFDTLNSAGIEDIKSIVKINADC